jgi:pimeloyl-ACP methyl ester carboxylesterase
LAQRLRRPVIAYDRLGFGRSDARTRLPGTDFIEREAEVYFPALCDQLGLSGFSLFGHSVGGGMAVTIAARMQTMCRSAVVVSAQAYVEQRTIDGVRQAKQFFGEPEQFARLTRWHGTKADWVLRAWTDVWLSDAFQCWSLKTELHQIECPMLVIHGEEDEYGSLAFPQFIADHSRADTTVMILAKCGHSPHQTHTSDVLDMVYGFLVLGK